MGKLGGVSLGAMWVGVWMSGGRGGGRAWLAGLLDSWIESDNRGEVAGPLDHPARIPRARIALHEPPCTLPYGDPADVLLFQLVADATWQRGGQAATRAATRARGVQAATRAWPWGVLLPLCATRLVRAPRPPLPGCAARGGAGPLPSLVGRGVLLLRGPRWPGRAPPACSPLPGCAARAGAGPLPRHGGTRFDDADGRQAGLSEKAGSRGERNNRVCPTIQRSADLEDSGFRTFVTTYPKT